ncbi:MAG: gliding motility-associated C-terminal domain-containing protein [Bacteroidetes bacterium]|nr:gliding motility-associated C-terminal domain-containing protein [Bacteroidota bacterium]
MKKTANILFFILMFHQYIFSQNFWAYSAGSIKEDETMDICYDYNGNIISAGYISGQTTFNYSTNLVLNSNSNGNPDIYISKSNSSGQIIWAVKAGGSGSDRATSVKSDANGNIYITGFYYGSATFGSIILSSVNGSQDGFIAKLDMNGVFIWAKSFGGNLAEWGNSITVDDLGNPIVTGQFQGSTNFSGTILTSMTNPNTMFASFDIFVAKYSPTGNLTWVKQGSAKYDDRGLDIISDSQNNIYVCGQFSDTIQFQNTHNNMIMNASFIIKYNANGQEQWFRKATGVFSIPYSMVMDNSNKIYITGDFQGSLTYFGLSGNSFINGTYSNKTFLMKIDNAGNFIWGKSESSTNYLSGKRVALDAQQDPYIFGEFGCTMTEYSDAYGPGVFNSIGFGDLFITKYNNTGTRQWFRHFGGPRNDKAHGLLVAGINEPIMAGSYEHHLNIPSTYGSLLTINDNNATNNNYNLIQPGNYCSANNNYTDYTALSCQGYSDAFIFKGIDLTRNPYDYYDRKGSSCNLDFVGNCFQNSFLNCTDTIPFCLNGYISPNTHASTTQLYFNTYGIGPIHRYVWNNNLHDTLSSLYVNTSGYNSVKVTTLDGCYTSRDTVYVKINPLPPPPVITDSYGANTLQPPFTHSIHICGPSTITLTGGNVQNTTYSWSGGYISTHDSIAIINATGNYSFTVVDRNGCVNGNDIWIEIDAPMTPFIPKQTTDSIFICQGNTDIIYVYDTVSNPSGLYPYPCVDHTISGIISSSPGLYILNGNQCNLYLQASANVSGWYKYSYKYGYTSLCGTYTATLNDSIYITVKPLPTGTITVTGNANLCPGDSSLVSVTSVSVSSVNTSYTVSPSTPFWVHQQGPVSFYLSMTDTLSGCTNYDYSTVMVTVKPNPFIILSPYNSIICPNDSIKLTINLPGATTYEWHGPGGIIPINSQSIYSKIAGFYHCIVTDNTGCVFTTNTVELKQYATPYLISTPINVICNNQPINLHVNTLDSTLIVWNSPLSGGGATKVITSPGIYSCLVTMCGITTSLSINIAGSTPTANISSSGPTSVCPFDSVLLTGNPGMTNYIWQPGNHIGQNYMVHSAGSYTLEVTDIYGCIAKSSPVTVTFTSNIAPPSGIVNDTICSGQTATLTAINSGTNQMEWFSNPNSAPVINTGNTYYTPVINSQTSYYVTNVSPGGCHSFGVPATVFIYPTSLPPILTSDTTVCKHDSIKITTSYINGATYQWSGPGITTNTTTTIQIPNADSTHAGTYSLQISGFGCPSSTSSINIYVLNPLKAFITDIDSICDHSNYVFAINPVRANYIYEWVGPNGYSNTSDSLIISNAHINQSGIYTVTSNLYGCTSAPSTLSLTVLETPVTPIITSNSPCVGDSLHLNVNNPNQNYTYQWFSMNGPIGTNSSLSILATDTSFSGYYEVIAANRFCFSPIAYDTVKIVPYPVLHTSPDTIACENTSIILSCQSSYNNYNWNTGSTNTTISVNQSGTYWVSSQNGSCIKTDSIHVSFVSCENFDINVFTPNGDGINDIFIFKSKAIKDIHCEIRNRWGEKIAEFTGRENGWNGKNMISNQICEEGTYFYIAQIKTIEGTAKTVNGFVTLIR